MSDESFGIETFFLLSSCTVLLFVDLHKEDSSNHTISQKRKEGREQQIKIFNTIMFSFVKIPSHSELNALDTTSSDKAFDVSNSDYSPSVDGPYDEGRREGRSKVPRVSSEDDFECNNEAWNPGWSTHKKGVPLYIYWIIANIVIGIIVFYNFSTTNNAMQTDKDK